MFITTPEFHEINIFPSRFGSLFFSFNSDDFFFHFVADNGEKCCKIILKTLFSSQIVECGKCHLRFRQEDFEPHFNEAHRDEQFLSFSVSNSGSSANAGLVGFDASSSSSSFSSGNNKTCSICLKVLTKKDYLEHFKESHSDVRLGCPKCPQTYHSPELLNVHYKHFHFKKSSQGKKLVS